MRLEAVEALKEVGDSDIKIEFAVQSEKLSDSLFNKFKIERELYHAALEKYKLFEDSEVKQIIRMTDQAIC